MKLIERFKNRTTLRQHIANRRVARAIEKREAKFHKGKAAINQGLKQFSSRQDMMEALTQLLAQNCSEAECEFYASQFGRRAHNMGRARANQQRHEGWLRSRGHDVQPVEEPPAFYREIQYLE